MQVVIGEEKPRLHRARAAAGLAALQLHVRYMPLHASFTASFTEEEARLQAALRAQCYTCESPGLVLERINLQIHASTDPQHFATLFLAIFDPENRELVYSSGGHNAPIVMRHDGNLELLEKGGLPLGAFDFGVYEEGKVTLDMGDLLFLYTDGLTETQDPEGEDEFGEERLNTLLREQRELDVDEVFRTVNRSLAEFSGREDADDDITMVGLKIVAANDFALAEEGLT